MFLPLLGSFCLKIKVTSIFSSSEFVCVWGGGGGGGGGILWQLEREKRRSANVFSFGLSRRSDILFIDILRWLDNSVFQVHGHGQKFRWVSGCASAVCLVRLQGQRACLLRVCVPEVRWARKVLGKPCWEKQSVFNFWTKTLRSICSC